MDNYNVATLQSGLKVIHRQTASNVIYCGFQIAVGTRNELKGEEGMAHFCEHMLFKGTRQRTNWDIINGLERVGGDLNAFTSKDTTVVHAAVINTHLQRAISLLADIVFCSEFPQRAIDKEVEVVCDEIESYNDNPAELIYDEFERWLFPNHPLGNNILGNAQQLRTYKTEDFLRFHRRFYKPQNAVFFIDGNVGFNRIVKLLRNAGLDVVMQNNNITTELPTPIIQNSQLITENPLLCQPPTDTYREIINHTHQAHVMIGCRSYAVGSCHRLALYLLNNILGGPGMNTSFNIGLRERLGLVYTIESFMTTYSDTGVWATYFGCDHKDIGKCCKRVGKILSDYSKAPISPTKLAAAKRQLKGQIGIAADQREQFALDFGKTFLHYNRTYNTDKLLNDIDNLTADDLHWVANDLFNEGNLKTLVIK